MERADKATRELEKVLSAAAAAGKEDNVKALYLMGKAKRMMRKLFPNPQSAANQSCQGVNVMNGGLSLTASGLQVSNNFQ